MPVKNKNQNNALNLSSDSIDVLRESEQWWHLLIRNLPDIIVTVDRSGKILAINHSVITPIEKVIGRSIYAFAPPESCKVIKNSLKRVFQTGQLDTYEILATGPNGPASAWYESRVIPIRRNNHVVAATVIAVDVTQRKKAEERLKESESRLLEQKQALEHKTVALGEIIKQIEVEKAKIKEDIAININDILLPIVAKLKIKNAGRKYIQLLQFHLRELGSSFGRKITEKSARLTSREIEICSMIKGGLTSKEAAQLLDISHQTVERHRKNIRNKLGISNKDINLTSFLYSLK